MYQFVIMQVLTCYVLVHVSKVFFAALSGQISRIAPDRPRLEAVERGRRALRDCGPSGSKGKYLARGTDPSFPASPDLTQSITISSHIFSWKEDALMAFLMRPHTLFPSCHYRSAALVRSLFFLWFSKEVARGALRVI